MDEPEYLRENSLKIWNFSSDRANQEIEDWDMKMIHNINRCYGVHECLSKAVFLWIEGMRYWRGKDRLKETYFYGLCIKKKWGKGIRNSPKVEVKLPFESGRGWVGLLGLS